MFPLSNAKSEYHSLETPDLDTWQIYVNGWDHSPVANISPNSFLLAWCISGRDRAPSFFPVIYFAETSHVPFALHTLVSQSSDTKGVHHIGKECPRLNRPSH